MSDQLPALRNEDALVVPESWRAVLHPRRGGVPGPDIEVDRTAPEALRARVQAARTQIDAACSGPGSDAEVVARIRDHLGGRPNPQGAAATARIAFIASPQGTNDSRLFVDAWAAEHGVAFAACAFVEFCGIHVDTGVRLLRADESTSSWWSPGAARMRALLASADKDDYREAESALAGHRRTLLLRRVVSFLVPGRQDWVDECCASPTSETDSWMVWCSLESAEQLWRLGPWGKLGSDELTPAILATVAEGVGSALTPTLVEALDEDLIDTDERKLILEVLGTLPGDEPFGALVRRIDGKHVLPALLAALERYPERALRLLAPESASGMVDELLLGHLRAHPELLGADLPGDAVRVLAKRLERAADALPDDLPRLLVEPPWAFKRKRKKPVVIDGLAPPDEGTVVWAPGERERWAAEGARVCSTFPDDTDWPAIVQPGRLNADVVLRGPEDLIRPLLPDWSPGAWDALGGLRPVLARFELDAVPAAVRAMRSHWHEVGELLLPFADTATAAVVADWLVRLKSARALATGWLTRHGVTAVPLLVPAALGAAGPDRRNAEAALRFLAGRFGAAEVVDAARLHGERAAAAIEDLLSADALDAYPARVPKVGEWADPALLPQVLLRDRRRALPPDSSGHLLTMLAMSKPGAPYAGVEVVRETCDPGSLAEFGWALCQRWRMNGADPKNAWALHQLAWTGDDGTARLLASFVRDEAAGGASARAVSGLDVLADIGTDVALAQLHRLGQQLRRTSVRTRARERFELLATNLGLTGDQLADRSVPDFGLDAAGSMTLDYGPRRFTVGFDEQLRPFVTDRDGRPRNALPRPSASDDQDLAPAAHRRFAALKKDVRATAADAVRRLERAMVTGRRWTPEEFREHLVGHPLLWHIVRRLVWLVEDGGAVTPFRLDEERAFAGEDDGVPLVPETARIVLAHPVHLGERLAAWAEILDDYEIVQPFPQLTRTAHVLDDAERASDRLRRFDGRTVPGDTADTLPLRGWERDGVELVRDLPGNASLALTLAPGLDSGTADRDQSITRVRLRAGTFGGLDPAAASEIIAYLTTLTTETSPR